MLEHPPGFALVLESTLWIQMYRILYLKYNKYSYFTYCNKMSLRLVMPFFNIIYFHSNFFNQLNIITLAPVLLGTRHLKVAFPRLPMISWYLRMFKGGHTCSDFRWWWDYCLEDSSSIRCSNKAHAQRVQKCISYPWSRRSGAHTRPCHETLLPVLTGNEKNVRTNVTFHCFHLLCL